MEVIAFLLTPLREGRLKLNDAAEVSFNPFLLTPLREGRPGRSPRTATAEHFYSRPCGRGDTTATALAMKNIISTHAPAGGATRTAQARIHGEGIFLLTPLREGRPVYAAIFPRRNDISTHAPAGGATKLTPTGKETKCYFYSRPCGRGDLPGTDFVNQSFAFLLTPLREGRRLPQWCRRSSRPYFYSRPCGRGDGF